MKKNNANSNPTILNIDIDTKELKNSAKKLINLVLQKKKMNFPISLELITGESSENEIVKDPPTPLSPDKLIELIKTKYFVTFKNKSQLEETKNFLDSFSYRKFQPFIKQNKGKSIDFAFELYHLDEIIRVNLARILPPIENYIKHNLTKTILAYSKKCDCIPEKIAFAYEHYNTVLCRSNQEDGERNYNEWISQTVENLIDYSSSDTSISQAFKKYNGDIPIWLTLDKVTFGSASKLLTVLNKELSKDCGSNIFRTTTSSPNNKPKATSIFELTRAVVILRNKVSHSANVVFKNHLVLSKKQFSENDIKSLLPDNIDSQFKKENEPQLSASLFWSLLAVKYFYIGLPNKYQKIWNSFLNKLKCFPSLMVLETALCFPDNWYEILWINI